MSSLDVEGLKTYFFTEAGSVKAVDDVSFSVKRSGTTGLVGESGSGKSVTTQSVLRIVPKPGRIVAGKISFEKESKTSQVAGRRGGNISLSPSVQRWYETEDMYSESIASES